MMRRIVLCLLLALSSSPSSVRAAAPEADPIAIRIDRWSGEGLTLSMTVRGDLDGETLLSNKTCCGIPNGRSFIRNVRVRASNRPVPVEATPSGWRVRHTSGVPLTLTYRLAPSGPLRIATGTAGQYRPLVDDRTYHLIGSTSLLLPVGRSDDTPVELRFDATKVATRGRFVSSFGVGEALQGIPTTLGQVKTALFLGGDVHLAVHDLPSGRVAVAFSGLQSSVREDALRGDALAIVATERRFFDDGQPWFLISVRGAAREGSRIHLGGGHGETNAFSMYVADDFDATSDEQREQFRWVLAHEYFHQWNGRMLQVASLPGSENDDASVYWFSEGLTEFYAMRLLTRAGLQTPAQSLDVLNAKLARYGSNSKRAISAREAGPLFWTDADAEQIPYLRGYLAAWYADLASMRFAGTDHGLDEAIRSLVSRARADPAFRVDNAFLTAYLGERMSTGDALALRRFIADGGEAPFGPDSFGPCLMGRREAIADTSVLQLSFGSDGPVCFRH